jgi:Ca2+/Na+ antiporter
MLIQGHFSVPLPTSEEARIVRVVELEHVKRDVGDIPDGQSKFDNAFWGFLGCGAPFLIQALISIPEGLDALQLILGIVLIAVAVLFLYFAQKQEDEKTKAIEKIRQDIDDFSNRVRVEKEPAGLPDSFS